MIQLFTDYAKEQLEYVETHGLSGKFEGYEYDVGNVWNAWIKDPGCRDLRETMDRIYAVLMADPSEQELSAFDDFLLIYGADALAVLPRLGAEVRTSFFGRPYCTHNAIALLKLYADDGEEAKAAQLARDIAETEESLLGCFCYDPDSCEVAWLKGKYSAILKGKAAPDARADAETEDDDEPGKGFKCVSSVSGYTIAFARTHAEMEEPEHTFRPAPPRLRGDFIRYIYDHPAGTDWFGLTEEDRERLLRCIEDEE